MPSIEQANQHLLETQRNRVERDSQDRMKQSEKMLFSQFQDSLKLFMSSIKYQDPMDPVDTSEMSKQMFQLSQAQGMFSINEKLEEQNSLLRAGQVLNATNLIGKMIEVNNDTFNLDEEKEAQLSCTLPQGVSSAKIEILDSKDRVVYQKELTPKAGAEYLDSGKQPLTWAGDVNTDYGRGLNEGKALSSGVYHVRVRPFDEDGHPLVNIYDNKPVVIPTTTRGILKGSDFSNKTPHIVMADSKLPLNAIVSIQDKKTEAIPEVVNRQERIKEIMGPLQEGDKAEIMNWLNAESDSVKADRKMEQKLNRLSQDKYEELNRKIANKLEIKIEGDE